jgi:hypothetical protein
MLNNWFNGANEFLTILGVRYSAISNFHHDYKYREKHAKYRNQQ